MPPIPRATYRLQLHKDFTFADAEALVPYLAALGISHLYLSPFLKARAGSLHGYDIIAHDQINPEIGDMAGLERLSAALTRRGMGLIMDFVPNHMGVGGADNLWWLDVLEWGEDSPYARFFDIDWQPPRRELKGKVLLPFLGDHYGAALERGELVPRFDRAQGSVSVWYWEHRFPIAIRDYAALIRPAVARLVEDIADDLADIVDDFSNFSAEYVVGRSISARRHRAEDMKGRLGGLATARPAVGDALDAVMAELAADLPILHGLLERQSYRVSYWRVAADEINYRRFFDINSLAALRMVEEPDLFDRAHRLVFDLLRRNLVQGLRIDHVDGLFDPAEYCRALKEGVGQGIYLVVEKILAHHEPIRRDWPVAGTTGYDFMNQVGGLFVDGQAEAAMASTYGHFIEIPMDFEHEVYEAKKRIIDENMASELRVLAARLGRIALTHWRSRDFTLSVLYQALKEVVACLPVYRTYVTSRRVTENDHRYIEWAIARARRMAPADPSVFDFLAGVLDTSLARAGSYPRRAVIDFAMRLQQYSGPVMAKGTEDTALYRYNRLIALNEVGGDPTRFGQSPVNFHQANRARLRSHPHAMLATATHDSKRGEDARPRIAVLSELPEEWHQHLERWSQLNASFRKQLDSGPAPEPNDEYWLYQTILGSWPGGGGADFPDRLAAVAVKAAKEAKRRTSWARPDEQYEQAVAEFARRICETERRNAFLDDLRNLHRRIAAVGMLNGLAQTLLKLTVPGVPDIYQGCELWDLSMVDPDNRRPVDFALRRRLLGSLEEGGLPADPARWQDGAIKQELIRRVLALRARMPQLFTEGTYRPLPVRGQNADRLVAFARQSGETTMVVAVPLLTVRLWPDGLEQAPLGAVWRGLHVEAPRRGSGGQYRDLLAEREVGVVMRRGVAVLPATELFAAFPLALLVAAAV